MLSLAAASFNQILNVLHDLQIHQGYKSLRDYPIERFQAWAPTCDTTSINHCTLCIFDGHGKDAFNKGVSLAIVEEPSQQRMGENKKQPQFADVHWFWSPMRYFTKAERDITNWCLGSSYGLEWEYDLAMLVFDEQMPREPMQLATPGILAEFRSNLLAPSKLMQLFNCPEGVEFFHQISSRKDMSGQTEQVSDPFDLQLAG